MDKTTFLEIPYPDENQDPFYLAYRQQMEAMSRVMFMSKIQAQLLLGGGGNITFNHSTNLLTWTQDFIVPVYYYGYKLSIRFGQDFVSRQASLADGSALVIEIPYVLTENKVVNFQVQNAINQQNHQLFVCGFRAGNKVYIKGVGAFGI